MKKKIFITLLMIIMVLKGFAFAQIEAEQPIAEEPAVTEEVTEETAVGEEEKSGEGVPKEEVAVEEPAVAEPAVAEPAVAEEIKEGKPAIAIQDFNAQGVSSSEAAFISDFFRSALVSLKAFRVIDRANMERILAEQGFQQTGCTTQECAVRMGRLLNVKNIVSGNFGKLGELYQMTVKVVNVESGEIIYTDSASCPSTDELQLKTGELASKMAAAIGVIPEEKPEPEKEPVKKEITEKEVESETVNRFRVPEFPEDEFEPPVRFERVGRPPVFAREPEKGGIAPYYSFQFSEGMAFPAISSGSVSSDWFFASNLVNDAGFILKPSERYSLMVFYELKYTGPGLERQEGRVFSEKTIDHIMFGQLQIGITDRLKLKVVRNYMTELQRSGTDEEWTTGMYNFNRTGTDIRMELSNVLGGYKFSMGLQRNYLSFPNYFNPIIQAQMGAAFSEAGGFQDQIAYAGVISLTGKNLRITWKHEIQDYEKQKVICSSGTYSDTLLQQDKSSALNISARLGRRFSVSPVLILKKKSSNQNYLHFEDFLDISPDFQAEYYNYIQGSISTVVRWRIFPELELFCVPRYDRRLYTSRNPRDVNNIFLTRSHQRNNAIIVSGGFTRFYDKVSSCSVYYTYVKQESNMKYEKYTPYNYTGQYFGIRFNFTF